MTAFDKKINQIATRHRWNIEKQARAAVPCYIIAAPTYEDAGKSSSVNGWPSFAIRSRTACKIYPCMLCPDAFAAAFIAFASGVNGFRFICVHFALYLSLFSLFLADTAIILPLFIFIYKI